MSETLNIETVEPKQTKQGKHYLRVKAGGRWLSVWGESDMEKLREAEGQEIKGSVAEKDGFFNLTHVDVLGESPKLGDGTYVKGKENPSTQRSIMASVALEHAVVLVKDRLAAKPDLTVDDAAKVVESLATRFHVHLLRRARIMDADDIPFGEPGD